MRVNTFTAAVSSNLGTRLTHVLFPTRTALEALTHAKFSTASDVWSYAVTLWEIYSLGRTPWEGLSPIAIRDNLAQGERLGRPERCPPEVYKLMLSCWERLAQDRPTFTDIHERIQTVSSPASWLIPFPPLPLCSPVAVPLFLSVPCSCPPLPLCSL